jgi:hypothetical protein
MIRLGPASYAGRGKKRGLGTEVETVYVLRIGYRVRLLGLFSAHPANWNPQ